MTEQPSSAEQTGWRRIRWYAALPLVWVVVAAARLAGGGWGLAAAFLIVPGTVLVLTRAARGAAADSIDPIERTDIERRFLWGGVVVGLLGVLLTPSALTAAYQLTVMDRHEAEVIAVYPDGYHWSGRNHEIKYDNIVLDVAEGSPLTIQAPSRDGLATGDTVALWADPTGFASARPAPGTGSAVLGTVLGLLTLVDVWLRRRHREVFGALTPRSQRLQLARRERDRVRAAHPDTPDEARARSNRAARRTIWAVSAVIVTFLVGTVLLALRDPAWGAIPVPLVAVGGTFFALLLLIAWGLADKGTMSGCVGVPLVLGLIFVDVAGFFFVGWVGADLVVRASVPADRVTVTRVQDREDTSYAINQRDSGSVVSFRRDDGSVSDRPVLSDRRPENVGRTLEVRQPSWHWVGVRSTDESPRGWAQVTAGVLALVMAGQAAATGVGYRRRLREPAEVSGA